MSEKIAVPEEKDILFGRGGESNNNSGNKLYQRILEEKSFQYLQCSRRLEKTQLAWGIFLELRNEGIRFLKKQAFDGSRDAWIEAGDDECRKKISQRLREYAFLVKKRDYAQTETAPSPRRPYHQDLLQACSDVLITEITPKGRTSCGSDADPVEDINLPHHNCDASFVSLSEEGSTGSLFGGDMADIFCEVFPDTVVTNIPEGRLWDYHIDEALLSPELKEEQPAKRIRRSFL